MPSAKARPLKGKTPRIKIVRSLHAKSLIEVSGDVNEKMLPYATFGIRPSAREYLVALLKQQQL
jgi:hypothetical protein